MNDFTEPSEFVFLGDKTLDMKLSQLKFPELFDYDRWSQAKGTLSFFVKNHTTGEYYFEDKVQSRAIIAKVIDEVYRRKSK